MKKAYSLLVRRLLLRENRYLTNEELKELSTRLKLKYNESLNYLFTNHYIKRIIRGYFYVPNIEERKLSSSYPNVFKSIANAMEHKKINNWYFGLETAIKLNAITHEVFTIDYVVSDTIFRPKPIKILGHKVKFVKINKKLFGFGLKKHENYHYSDLEKTILDLIHIRKHNSETDNSIRNELIEWADEADHKKMMKYAKHYSKPVREMAAKLK